MISNVRSRQGMRENFSRKNRNDSSGHYHLPATHMHCTTQPVWPTLSAQTKITPKCFGPQEMLTPNNFDHPTFLTPQRFVTLTNVPQKCSTPTILVRHLWRTHFTRTNCPCLEGLVLDAPIEKLSFLCYLGQCVCG